MKFITTHKLAAMLMLAASLASCKKDTTSPQVVDEDVTVERATYASRSASFTHSDGAYSLSTAEADLGDVQGTWQSQNVDIFSNSVRVRIPANSISSQPASDGSGNIVRIDVPDGTEYTLTFKVRFGPNFQWSRGGKAGFGFMIGDGNTGCDKADDGNGGSARVMWYNPTNQKDNTGSDDPHFKPYVYYKDMPDQCGDGFGKNSVALSKNTWYTITIRVKSNTGSSSNGQVFYSVNGTTLLNKTDIRWTTNTAKRLINLISFTTFRGGSDPYWGSTTDGFIYYDDLSWNRLAS